MQRRLGRGDRPAVPYGLPPAALSVPLGGRRQAGERSDGPRVGGGLTDRAKPVPLSEAIPQSAVPPRNRLKSSPTSGVYRLLSVDDNGPSAGRGREAVSRLAGSPPFARDGAFSGNGGPCSCWPQKIRLVRAPYPKSSFRLCRGAARSAHSGRQSACQSLPSHRPVTCSRCYG